MVYTEINKRYSELAESSCCLSCGGALNYAQGTMVSFLALIYLKG
jgi:hypothetical protein